MEVYRSIALSGNPNVGKSTVFNGLTGQKQHTGNWAGKTVGSANGYFRVQERTYKLVDLPGTYSLWARSAEEMVTCSFIKANTVDGIAVVCDATCLERNLNLVLQIKATGHPVFVIVNLIDEAEKKGIAIDRECLEECLKVPVVLSAARKRDSIRQIAEQLDLWMQKLEYRQTEDGELQSSREKEGGSEERPKNYFRQAEEICQKAVTIKKEDYLHRDRKIDAVLVGKWTAYPVMLGLLALILWITIAGANVPSSYLAEFFFFAEERFTAFLKAVNAPPWLWGMLSEGVLRVTGWVIAVMLPPMAIFFPLFTLLEDAGYLPRIAYNLDRPFERCKACGKQGLTMCMGLGCNAVGVTGCRIIDSKRERLIAILTNNFMPCNGRFPTLLTIGTLFLFPAVAGNDTRFGSALLLTALILGAVLVTFFSSWLLSKTLLRGYASAFTMELPPYRRPQFTKVLFRSILDRTAFVLGRAVMVAAPAGLLLWILANVTWKSESLLSVCAGYLDPFASLLGLDGVILLAFILGFPANEIVVPIMLMAYMERGSLIALSNSVELKMLLEGQGFGMQNAICMLLFTLLHWPCSTTLLTIKKETGSIKWTLVAFLLPTLLGMFVCFLTAQMLRLFV